MDKKQKSMTEVEYNYVCPSCSKECSVPESLTGQNLICPTCSHEFFASPPETQATPQENFSLPEKLPFFKHGRKKILEKRVLELAANGGISEDGKSELKELAHKLELSDSDLEKIQESKFLEEFAPLKKQIEDAWHVTDENLADIRGLQKKYNIDLTLGGDIKVMHSIYLLEAKGQLPEPMAVDAMLGAEEPAYFAVATTWHQMRVTNRGYSGVSVSMPTGIKGVRFRVGNYSPMKTEDLKPLSDGSLFVTSKRLLFKGQIRSTTINLKKIIDCEVFRDGIKIEKETGKPDFFRMQLREALFMRALIGALKKG
jgi:DNA-directed RNA polymerase subunit RPC12/RpoP